MDLNSAISEMSTAIDEFKTGHSSRVDELQRRLDSLETKANRPGNPGIATGGISPEQKAHREAFGRFMRKGLDHGLADLEMKAFNIGTPAEGGYAVPEQIDRMIEALAVDLSPIRALCNVARANTSDYKKLVNQRGTASGWVGETDARTETATPALAEIAPAPGEIYANPAATQWALDDAFFNVEQWLADEVATEFAVQEDTAFVSGNGTNKPKGFLTYTTAATDDASRAFGTIQYVPSGAAGAWSANDHDAADVLITTIHKLKAAYRRGAVWIMNTATVESVRKLKDADNNYLWRPGMAEGQPATLLGYPVIEDENMPDIAADSLSIAFANMRRAYLIVDHVAGTRVLRDPYTSKGKVFFYTTKRLAGALQNSEAIKLVKFAAS